MPTSQNIYTVDVIGTNPSDPAAWDYLLTDIYSRYYEPSPADIPAPPQEAFAPPPPAVLPEVVVQPPKAAPAPEPRIPWKIPLEIGAGLVRTIVGGAAAILFPQPTGPAAFDEAPSAPPAPPKSRPPAVPGDETPPNWEDIGLEPFREFPQPKNIPDFGSLFRWSRWLDLGSSPKGPDVNLPLLEEFTVNAPSRTTRSAPFPSIIELPYARPDFGLDFGTYLGLGSAPAPGSPTRSDPKPAVPDLFPVDRQRRDVPLPKIDLAPDLFGAPLPDVIGDRLGNPTLAPQRPTTPRGNPSVPDYFGPADVAPAPTFADPLAEFKPEPFTPNKDQCQCAKKKPQKKRSPRTVCYRGTYTETRSGTLKKRLEEIPCESSKQVASRTRSTRKPKLKPGQFPAMSLTGNQVGELATDALAQFAPIVYDWWKDRQPKKTTRKRNRKAKTKPGRLPGTVFTTPFYTGD